MDYNPAALTGQTEWPRPNPTRDLLRSSPGHGPVALSRRRGSPLADRHSAPGTRGARVGETGPGAPGARHGGWRLAGTAGRQGIPHRPHGRSGRLGARRSRRRCTDSSAQPGRGHRHSEDLTGFTAIVFVMDWRSVRGDLTSTAFRQACQVSEKTAKVI